MSRASASERLDEETPLASEVPQVRDRPPRRPAPLRRPREVPVLAPGRHAPRGGGPARVPLRGAPAPEVLHLRLPGDGADPRPRAGELRRRRRAHLVTAGEADPNGMYPWSKRLC